MSTNGKKSVSKSAAEGGVESMSIPLAGPSGRDDIWDDSIIIKKYDSSLALIKEEVAKRLAMNTNRKFLDETAGCSSSSSNRKYQKMDTDSVGEAAGGSPSHEEKGTKEISEQDQANNALPGTFELGDYVRATYDDGVDYEAKIIGFGSHGDCQIRYVGYNNEQTVLLDELLPSWGRKARRQQRMEAAEAEATAADSQMDVSDDERFTKQASKIKINFGPNFGRTNSGLSATGAAAARGMSGRSDMRGACGSYGYMIPPPPPMPPMLEDADDIESENLSAMLMSWYMSGYYTGVYHGQRMSQQQQQQQQHQQQSQQAQQQKRARQS